MAACNIGIVTFKDIDLSSRIGILKKSTQVYMMLKRMLRYAFLITQCVWNYGIIKSKHTEIKAAKPSCHTQTILFQHSR